MSAQKSNYDDFLAKIYDYSYYFGKERFEKNYATPFYLRNISKNKTKSVLELVTCTGQLTIPIAREGYKIESIDISRSMQDILLKKLESECQFVSNNIKLRCVNVFSFNSKVQYDTIVMPDSFLCAISNIRLQEKLIGMCYRMLKEKGMLILDIFVPWDEIIKKGEARQCTRFRMPSGEVYIEQVHHLIDKKTQTHRFDFTHRLYKNERTYNHTLTYRYMYTPELVSLLEKNGFEIIDENKDMNFGRNVAIAARKRG